MWRSDTKNSIFFNFFGILWNFGKSFGDWLLLENHVQIHRLDEIWLSFPSMMSWCRSWPSWRRKESGKWHIKHNFREFWVVKAVRIQIQIPSSIILNGAKHSSLLLCVWIFALYGKNTNRPLKPESVMQLSVLMCSDVKWWSIQNPALLRDRASLY